MTHKIKICHIITRMDWGGSTELVRQLCSGLSQERFEVTLVTGITRHPTRKTREFLAGKGVRIVVMRSLRREISLFHDPVALFMLYRFLRKNRFDIVHTHTAKAGVLGRIAAGWAGCRRVVHTPHGHNFYGYFNRYLAWLPVVIERFCAKMTARMVVLTQLEQYDYMAGRVCPGEKFSLIRPGVEEDFFFPPKRGREEMRRELGLPPHAKIVAMVSRLEPVKGPVYFIEACARLSVMHRDIGFLLVGEGAQREELLSRLEREDTRHIKEQFIFAGWREDVRDILGCVDLLVLPSLNEALGLVLLQAQACGVPIVASRVGGVAEAVKEGVTAVLVAAADSKGIAVAVDRLLRDGEAAAKMAEAGRKWVAAEFSVSRMVRSHEELYQRLFWPEGG